MLYWRTDHRHCDGFGTWPRQRDLRTEFKPVCIVRASLKRDLTFEVPTSFILLLFSVVLCVYLLVVQGKIRLWEVRGKSIYYSG